MMTIFIESGLICLLFSWVVVKGTKQNPLSGLHNLPLKIQERVAGIEAYQNIKILSVKQRIVKKIPALIVVFFISACLFISRVPIPLSKVFVMPLSYGEL